MHVGKVKVYNLINILKKNIETDCEGFSLIQNSLTKTQVDKCISWSPSCVIFYIETHLGDIDILYNAKKDTYYMFDHIGGNLYNFDIDNYELRNLTRSKITGNASDIGIPSKCGLLNDFIETFIGVNFLEGVSKNIEFKSLEVLEILEKVFKNNWSTDDLLKYVEESKELVREKWLPFKRLSEDGITITIPSYKALLNYTPDEFDLIFESKKPGFDVSIYEFSFYFDTNPNHFNGEGFIIEIDSRLYCFDLENEYYWVNRNAREVQGYEKFVTELEVTLFIRLFNKLEDLFKTERTDIVEEEIKKYILTLIYLLEVNLEIDSEIVSGNILDTILNIDKIIRITAGEINE